MPVRRDLETRVGAQLTARLEVTDMDHFTHLGITIDRLNHRRKEGDGCGAAWRVTDHRDVEGIGGLVDSDVGARGTARA
ncbi:MAG: hypothetical protein ABIT38_18610 [Gemmatimonadaceae bacterium]